MEIIRRNIFFRWIWGLYLLLIINISIDPPDLEPYWVPEDLSINEIESLIELILEEILCIDNAIAEYDELGNETVNGLSFKIFGLHFFWFVKYKLQSITLLHTNPLSLINNFSIIQFFGEPDSPPPEL